MIFNFTDKDMADPNFEQMGLQKYNVVQNLGSSLYYIVGFFFLVFIAGILRLLKNYYKL